MNKKEVRFVERMLTSFVDRPIQVLEWGSGGSTAYFSGFLDERSIEYKWVSIEYNRAWYEKVKADVTGNSRVSLVLFDVGNNHLRQRNTDMEEYITYPKTLGTRFDLIIVDGRKRRRCLLEARTLIKENGVVILHDAGRPYYHCAFPHYPDRRFVGPTMWRGKVQKLPHMQIFFNQIVSVYYRVLFLLFFIPYHRVKRMYSRYLMKKRARQ